MKHAQGIGADSDARTPPSAALPHRLGTISAGAEGLLPAAAAVNPLLVFNAQSRPPRAMKETHSVNWS